MLPSLVLSLIGLIHQYLVDIGLNYLLWCYGATESSTLREGC